MIVQRRVGVYPSPHKESRDTIIQGTAGVPPFEFADDLANGFVHLRVCPSCSRPWGGALRLCCYETRGNYVRWINPKAASSRRVGLSWGGSIHEAGQINAARLKLQHLARRNHGALTRPLINPSLNALGGTRVSAHYCLLVARQEFSPGFFTGK